MNDKNQTPENQLANFTDQFLNKEMDPPSLAADPDLRVIEKTVLRLGKAFEDEPSEAVIERMRTNILKEQPEAESKNFWTNWLLAPNRQRIGLAFSVALIAILFLVGPFIGTTDSTVVGTSGSHFPFAFVLAVLSGLVLVAAWLLRRKP